MDEYELVLKLEDEKAIDIVKKFPEHERCQIIEKYIVIGHTVLKYASVVTSEESLQRFFEPVIEDFRNLSESFGDTHRDYASMLSLIFPTLAKTKRGDLTCEIILDDLQNKFRGDVFEDVSKKPRSADIMGVPEFAAQPILIESKDYKEAVPSAEVKKFWRDMERRNAKVGCFFSLRSGIRTVTNDFAIRSKGSSLGIFVVIEAFNYQGHVFGYTIARKMLEMLIKEPTVSVEKYELVTKILTSRLQDLRYKMEDFENVEGEVVKAKDSIAKTLDSIAAKICELRSSIETIIENTFKDLSDISK